MRLMLVLIISVKYLLSQRIHLPKEHSFGEHSIVEMSEVMPPVDIIEPTHVESMSDLAYTTPISPLSASLPIFHHFLDAPKSTFIEFKAFA